MATVQRANVVLDIPDEEIDQYLELGYRVIDESGRVVKKMVLHDLPFLQKYYLETEKKIVELEAKVKALQEQLEEKNRVIFEERAEPKKKAKAKK